jgi:threonine dehydratase
VSTLTEPTLEDVLAARERIAPHLTRTPLRSYPALSRRIGVDILVKHENHLPTGAFKVRGGLNLVGALAPQLRGTAVAAASTGNHGQSVALAARVHGVRAIVCMPERPNPAKLEAIRDLGAEVVLHGADFDDAREHCEALAQQHGYRYVHSGDEPLLIAGVATAHLEILEDDAAVDTLIVPVGGGSGAAGACIVAESSERELRVIGVQAAAAPAAYKSWRERRPVADSCTTMAEGLATRTPFELPQRILRRRLDDFVLVDEDELAEATLLMVDKTRNLVEPAGAAAVAAALKLADELRGRRVAAIASGGNITLSQLQALVETKGAA